MNRTTSSRMSDQRTAPAAAGHAHFGPTGQIRTGGPDLVRGSRRRRSVILSVDDRAGEGEAVSTNGFYQGTIHHKGEPPEYFAEQAARRPRRQRILAIVLVLVAAPLFLAWSVVDLPRPNAQATVTGHVDVDVAHPQPTLQVTYDWRGATRTASIPVAADGAVDPLAAYPVGSTVSIKVHDRSADDPVGVTITYDEPVAGTGLAIASLVGAALLWSAARRNERRAAEQAGLPWKMEARQGLGLRRR